MRINEGMLNNLLLGVVLITILVIAIVLYNKKINRIKALIERNSKSVDEYFKHIESITNYATIQHETEIEIKEK